MKSTFLRHALVCSFALALLTLHVHAGSATWGLAPTSSDWSTAANWMPNTVPDGPEDVATFGASNQTTVVVSEFAMEVNELLFNPGASAFTINSATQWTISGAGISNNSGITQNFLVTGSDFLLVNDASAGDMTFFTVTKNNFVQFNDIASASHASFQLAGKDNTEGGLGGGISFFGHSTAAEGNFTVEGGSVPNADAGFLFFFDNSTAADAVITANGGTAEGAQGGHVLFTVGILTITGTAANATLIANPGTNGGNGGVITFRGNKVDRNTARFELFGNGTLDMSQTVARGKIGSIEGDGVAAISDALMIGANNLSTTFSGTIQGLGWIKVGTGTLTLTGANTYTNGTTIEGGALVISNQTGSGTGTGPVKVTEGQLGGSGTIAGTVTFGTGKGSGAFLAPSAGAEKHVTLTIQSALIFNADAAYVCTFRARGTKSQNDRVVSNGVTIKSGAQFDFSGQGRGKLIAGTSFTVINNTAGTPISGTFADLADGSIVKVGSTNFQADYEGGDGNDLTLTVVP